MNKQARDLASIVTIDDRNEFILEHEDFNNEGVDPIMHLPDKVSKAIGDKATTATRAMFSFKSEMNSLIGNLQETTKD